MFCTNESLGIAEIVGIILVSIGIFLTQVIKTGQRGAAPSRT